MKNNEEHLISFVTDQHVSIDRFSNTIKIIATVKHDNKKSSMQGKYIPINCTLKVGTLSLVYNLLKENIPLLSNRNDFSIHEVANKLHPKIIDATFIRSGTFH